MAATFSSGAQALTAAKQHDQLSCLELLSTSTRARYATVLGPNRLSAEATATRSSGPYAVDGQPKIASPGTDILADRSAFAQARAADLFYPKRNEIAREMK
jgi:hypothetical protein